MAGSRFREWFARRFMLIVEVTGYAITIAIGIGLFYSLFRQIEVVAHVSGELRPPATDLVFSSNALLLGYIATPGQVVRQGDPVLRVVLDEAAQRHVLAKRRLEAVVAMLEAAKDRAAQAAVEDIRRAVAELPVDEKAVVVTAPASGVFEQDADLSEDRVVPPGRPLARVYDTARLTLESSLGAPPVAANVVEGQVARVTPRDGCEPLIGRVRSIKTSGTARSVIVEFDNTPPSLRGRFVSDLSARGKAAPQPVRVDIVVGHRSLFREVFGRKQ